MTTSLMASKAMKTKRKILSIKEKHEIILDHDKGLTRVQLQNKFGIKRSTLHDIIKAREKILSSMSKLESTDKGMCLFRERKLPREDLDKAVFKWYTQQRAEGVPVRGIDIQNAALQLAEHLKIDDFKCSTGWLWRFRRRHGMLSKDITGEPLSALEEEEIEEWLDEDAARPGYHHQTDEEIVEEIISPEPQEPEDEEQEHKKSGPTLAACINAVDTLLSGADRFGDPLGQNFDMLCIIRLSLMKQHQERMVQKNSCFFKPVHSPSEKRQHIDSDASTSSVSSVSLPSTSTPCSSHTIKEEATEVKAEELLDFSMKEEVEERKEEIKAEPLDVDVFQPSLPETEQENCQNHHYENFLSNTDQTSIRECHGDKFIQADEVCSSLNDKSLKTQLLKHADEKSFKCDQCSFAANKKSRFLRHLSSHSGERPFACDQCSYTAKQKTHLLDHLLLHSVKRTYKCDQCSYTAKQKAGLRIHLLVHSEEKSFKCDQCSYAAKKKSNLHRHLLSHSSERRFKCGQCSFAAKHKSDLLQHILIHSEEKNYKCDQCPYATKQLGTLRRHIFNHSGERPFTCDQCSYSANRRATLHEHQLIHSEERTFKCDQCPFTARQKPVLRRHLQIHSDEKSFKCNQCSYATKDKSSLRRHQFNHSGERPFACDQCEYTAKTKSHLLGHLLIHSEKRNFKCDQCSFASRQKNGLRAHLLIHLKKKLNN